MDPAMEKVCAMLVFIGVTFLVEIAFKRIYGLKLRKRKNGFKVLREAIREVVKIMSPPRTRSQPKQPVEESVIMFNPTEVVNSTLIPDESVVTSTKRIQTYKSKRIENKRSEKDFPTSPWAKVSAKSIGKPKKVTPLKLSKVSNVKK